MPGDFIDDTHQAFCEFAERFLEEDERDSFIDSMMERHGYQRMSSWAAPEAPPAERAPLVAPKRQRAAGGQQQPAQQQPRRASSYFGGQK